MKKIIFLLLLAISLSAESFYVLTGVKFYDPIVVNNSSKIQHFSGEIKELMQEISKEIGVDTKGYPSRVLVFLIDDISMGDTVGLRVNLELGEYVKRDDQNKKVFALTYADSRLIAPDFKDKEDVEDRLADTVEEMLEKFKLQYIEDNRVKKSRQKSTTHEDFAKDMSYETNYEKAINRAKKEGKDVMVFMTTSYCPWCRKLEDRVLSLKEVDSKIKSKYIPLMLNLDKDSFPKELSKSRFTPIIYILDS
jgi:thiol-disulfide isomerase/thioredoxin